MSFFLLELLLFWIILSYWSLLGTIWMWAFVIRGDKVWWGFIWVNDLVWLSFAFFLLFLRGFVPFDYSINLLVRWWWFFSLFLFNLLHLVWCLVKRATPHNVILFSFVVGWCLLGFYAFEINPYRLLGLRHKGRRILWTIYWKRVQDWWHADFAKLLGLVLTVHFHYTDFIRTLPLASNETDTLSPHLSVLFEVWRRCLWAFQV